MIGKNRRHIQNVRIIHLQFISHLLVHTVSAAVTAGTRAWKNSPENSKSSVFILFWMLKNETGNNCGERSMSLS